MSQERLYQMVISVLIMAGYDVSERCDIRPRSFDLIASNGDILLVIKIASHIDSVSEDMAGDLALIALHLRGSPFIVGERSRDAELERGAIYGRYGIKAMSVSTLHDFVGEGIPPLVYASPGGLYVNIDGKLLRELRERHQMSLGEIASFLGISRRTVSKYESGMGTTLEIAIKIEELFDTAIVEAIDLLSYDAPPVRRTHETGEGFVSDLERIGLDLYPTARAPFQALAYYQEETILTGYGPAQKIIKRAALIGNLSEIAGIKAICVTKNFKKQKRVGKTLVIGEEDLNSLESGSELIELIGE